MSKRLRPWALIGVPALVLLGALIVWLQGGRYASTENAFVKADIAQIASEVAGRIIEVRARDHAVVAEGDVLVRLDPEPYRLALAKADAEIDSARATVEALKVSLRETRADAKETENRLAYLEVQAKRQRELSGRGVSSAAIPTNRPTAMRLFARRWRCAIARRSTFPTRTSRPRVRASSSTSSSSPASR